MSEWNNVVKNTWNENKHKAGYLFKHALVDAKKKYKSSKNNQTKHNKTRRNKTRKSRKSRR